MLLFLHAHAGIFGPLAEPLARAPLWLYALLLIGIVAATTVHEAGHAWMADRLGDPGPREQGRVSLNPLRHIDPLGFLVMAVTMLIGFPIGWGKSLKTDPEKFSCGPRKGAALVAAAGPLCNLILAAVLSPLVRLVLSGVIEPSPVIIAVTMAFLITILINVSQFCFNLILIHPMDASHVLLGFLPKDLGDKYLAFMQRWGVYLFLVLMFTELPGKFLMPIMRFIIWLLLGIQL